MLRNAIILLSWTLLSLAPILCHAGVLVHPCHCAEHEVAADPCCAAEADDHLHAEASCQTTDCSHGECSQHDCSHDGCERDPCRSLVTWNGDAKSVTLCPLGFMTPVLLAPIELPSQRSPSYGAQPRRQLFPYFRSDVPLRI